MPRRGPTEWRPDLYVVARLLEHLWRQDGPMVPTRLQVAGNVNYDVFTRYIEWMLSRGLVTRESSVDGSERIYLTGEGHEAYRRLVQWVNELVLRTKPGP